MLFENKIKIKSLIPIDLNKCMNLQMIVAFQTISTCCLNAYSTLCYTTKAHKMIFVTDILFQEIPLTIPCRFHLVFGFYIFVGCFIPGCLQINLIRSL